MPLQQQSLRCAIVPWNRWGDYHIFGEDTEAGALVTVRLFFLV